MFVWKKSDSGAPTLRAPPAMPAGDVNAVLSIVLAADFAEHDCVAAPDGYCVSCGGAGYHKAGCREIES